MIHGIFNLVAFLLIAVGSSGIIWTYVPIHWSVRLLLSSVAVLAAGYFVHGCLLRWTDFLFTDEERGFSTKEKKKDGND